MTDRDDIPTLKASDFARGRPASSVFSEKAIADFKSKGGRPKAAQTKIPVSIRLDPDLVEALKAEGAGWQSRANGLLRDAVLGEGPRTAAIRSGRNPATGATVKVKIGRSAASRTSKAPQRG